MTDSMFRGERGVEFRGIGMLADLDGLVVIVRVELATKESPGEGSAGWRLQKFLGKVGSSNSR